MDFACCDFTVDIKPLKKALEKTDQWDKYPFRRLGNSPHKEMVDIWARYNDIQPYLKTGDLSGLNDPHDSVWYRSQLTELIKPIAYKIMAKVGGERLGGILITKLQPYGKITTHTDDGWHAKYYDKYYVCIKDGGSKFIFESGYIRPKEGQVWWFDNSRPHGVENTNQERIAMIVCIKIDRSQQPCLGL